MASIARVSLSLTDTVKKLAPLNANLGVHLRTGVHSGNIVSGIVGTTKPKFCLFGEAVQIAFVLEASARAASQIHCSFDTKRIAENSNFQEFLFEESEQIKLNNSGLPTFYITFSRR